MSQYKVNGLGLELAAVEEVDVSQSLAVAGVSGSSFRYYDQKNEKVESKKFVDFVPEGEKIDDYSPVRSFRESSTRIQLAVIFSRLGVVPSKVSLQALRLLLDYSADQVSAWVDSDMPEELREPVAQLIASYIQLAAVIFEEGEERGSRGSSKAVALE